MAITRPKRREEFDRSRDFITTRPLLVSGTSYSSGDLVDKTLMETRKLRQLYDQRILEMTPVETVVEEVELKKTIPDFDQWSEEQITDWLRAHGKIPKFGTTFEQLVFKAIDVWEETHGEK